MAVIVESISRKSAGQTFRRGESQATASSHSIFSPQIQETVVAATEPRLLNVPMTSGSVDSPYFPGVTSFWHSRNAGGTVVSIGSNEVEWMAYLDDEERRTFERERYTQLLSARVRQDWQEFDEWLAVWKLRAAMAKTYSTPLTEEQHVERDAWETIQDEALDDIFAVGA